MTKEEIRMKLWCDVYCAALNKANAIPAGYADEALKIFDKRFPAESSGTEIEAESRLLNLTEELLRYADEKGAIMAPQIRKLVREASAAEISEPVESIETAVKTSIYGFCPICGAAGKSRERRPDGNDTCINDHVYPSKNAVIEPDTTNDRGSNQYANPVDEPRTVWVTFGKHGDALFVHENVDGAEQFENVAYAQFQQVGPMVRRDDE